MSAVREAVRPRELARRRFVTATTLVVLAACGYLAPGAWAGFGFVPGSVTTAALNRNGTVDRQAGSHPYEYKLSFELNHRQNPIRTSDEEPEGYMRSVEVDLPPGLVGNPGAVPRCSRHDFEGEFTKCPGDTEIGFIRALVAGAPEAIIPVYDLVPLPGVPASFGFSATSLNGIEEASVRTGAGYGVQVSVDNSPAPVIRAEETIWGVPPEESHNHERTCIFETEAKEIEKVDGCSSQVTPRPFLTLPTSCTGPLVTTLRAVSLQGEEAVAEAVSRNDAGQPAGLSGCEKLSFAPRLSVQPDTHSAESPSGLIAELEIPQPEDVGTLAEADLEEAQVVLPKGMTVSPSAASGGLQGCPLSRIDLASPAPAHCPNASKLGNVEVQTPLLEHPLRGSVFLAEQGDLLRNGPESPLDAPSNPFGSLLAMYVVVEGEGVVAKIPGEIELDEKTGQLTARFGGVEDKVTGEVFLPQVPYSRLKMSFFGGPQAALLTPTECGTYETTSTLTAWSSTPEHLVVAEPSSSFTIGEGCSHTFKPSFVAGTTNSQAAAHSPFVTSIARDDGEQRLEGFTETLPPGLLADIAGVALCGSAEAVAGVCPEASKIGIVTASAGPGREPLLVNGGIYLTGPYEGAPFGEVAEIPAVAGPFNLNENALADPPSPAQNGRPVTVRGAITIDPMTGQATVKSDPFPQFVFNAGVPTDIRKVSVTLNRPEFTFNPTNCSALSITARLTSAKGESTVAESSPFHAANCAALPFKPLFEVSTEAKTSKAGGAGLTVKVAEKPGEEANIAKVDLQIPKVLPARLTTLQKACAEKQFETNPAGCPEGSVIATATAHTPILKEPLTGPGYLVSHGNAAFPDVEFVLQATERGGTVEIILDGKTDIKGGITYSRFETVPDAPVSSFETVLPEGPHSALTTEQPGQTNLCAPTKTVKVKKRVAVRGKRGHIRHVTRSVTQRVAVPLTIPTTITGQNGAVISQNTKVNVTGCPKREPAHTPKNKKKKR